MSQAQEDRFYATYERLSQAGQCDSPGGREYQRVLQEWLALGCPSNLEDFIYCRANLGPDGLGPEQWQ